MLHFAAAGSLLRGPVAEGCQEGRLSKSANRGLDESARLLPRLRTDRPNAHGWQADRFGFPVQTVLRSGCYLTHDHGIYRRTSPLDGRGSPTGPRLQPAFELLASVLSRPEPTLVIVGFGRRDVPIDDQLPVVLRRYGHNRRRSDAPGVRVTKLNDQHAFLQVPEELQVGLGEVWSFGVSHACGAFDRWPAIPLVDHGHQITGAITTDL